MTRDDESLLGCLGMTGMTGMTAGLPPFNWNS